MGFFSQEYWGGLPFPSPSDLPDPGIEPGSPSLQVDSLPSESPKDPSLLNSVPFKSRNATSQWFQNLQRRSLLLPINTLYCNYLCACVSSQNRSSWISVSLPLPTPPTPASSRVPGIQWVLSALVERENSRREMVVDK